MTGKMRILTALFVAMAIPPLYCFISSHVLHNSFSTAEFIALMALFVPAWATLFYLLHRENRNLGRVHGELREQMRWMNLVMNHSNELIFILDPFSRILTINTIASETFSRARGEIVGKPLRDILFNEYFDRLRLNEIILFKLKEVFSGNEAELVYTLKQRKRNEILTFVFRMTPIFSGKELEYILVIGRQVQSDSFARNYMVCEASEYRLDNNISQVYIFCHRLTRNLLERLPRNTVMMAQIALQEVLINSIEHGNLEIGYEKKTELRHREGNYWEHLIRECNVDYLKNRKIHVSYRLDNEKVTYVIRDEGAGFDWRSYINRESEIVKSGVFSTYHGFGLQIARSCFDVSFNESGNIVTMTKYFTRTAAHDKNVPQPGADG